MQKPGEIKESERDYQARLNSILSTPLTAENIDSYADDAIDSTIELINDIIVDPHYKWDITLAENKKETEDRILQEVLDTNVEDILNHIIDIKDDINKIDFKIADSRKSNKDSVYIPPDKTTVNIVTNNGSFNQIYLLPKAKIALFILENDFEVDLDDPRQFNMNTGMVRPEMMRQTPYDMIEAPELNRAILSCDEIGNRTFVFDTEKLKEAKITTDFLLDATKTELDQIMKDYPKIGQSLVYSQNYADRLKKALANIEEQNTNIEERPKETNYLKTAKKAPEGWYTLKGLKKELGIDTNTIKPKISNLQGKEYKDISGHINQHYNLEEIKNIPEIKKLLETPTAPEGWYTLWGLEKELGISTYAIKPKISNLQEKEYRDTRGHIIPHYNLEEIKNIPEIKKLLETPTAPEGWCTLGGLEKELGIGRNTIKPKISNLQGKEYRDMSGHINPHYNLEEIKNIPEIKKLLETPTAPEGWCTLGGLEKELGISTHAIKPKISNLQGKEYRDITGRIIPHYNLEEIKNIPEIQEAVKKAELRQRAKTTLKATDQSAN